MNEAYHRIDQDDFTSASEFLYGACVQALKEFWNVHYIDPVTHTVNNEFFRLMSQWTTNPGFYQAWDILQKSVKINLFLKN